MTISNNQLTGDLASAIGPVVNDLTTGGVQSPLAAAQGPILKAASDANAAAIATHNARTDNPHATTAAQVGLGAVNNTADSAKPVSTLQAAAIALKAPIDAPVFTTSVTLPGPGTAAGHAVSRQQLDDALQGLKPKGSADYRTVAALPANVYANGALGVGATLTGSANGALSVDGAAVAVGDVIAVGDEATGSRNGLYVVTATGGAGAPYVLTRSPAMDVATEFAGAFIVVTKGTQAGRVMYATFTGTFVVGTTALAWTASTATLNSTDALTEGTTNLYFGAARVRGVVMAGISFVSNALVTAADTLLVAVGKLQAQITALGASLGAKADSANPTLTGVMTFGGAQLAVGVPIVGGAINTQLMVNTADVTGPTNFSFTGPLTPGLLFGMVLKTTAAVHQLPAHINGNTQQPGTLVAFPEAGEFPMFFRVNAAGVPVITGIPVAPLPADALTSAQLASLLQLTPVMGAALITLGIGPNPFSDELKKQDALDKQLEFYEQMMYPKIWFDATKGSEVASGPTADDGSTEQRAFRDFTVARGCVPGKIAMVKRGTTPLAAAAGLTSTCLQISTSGTAQAPIIIQAYGEGERPLFDGAGANRGIRMDVGVRHVRLRGLRTGNCSAGTFRLGISNAVADADAAENDPHFIVVEDCEVFNIEDDAAEAALVPRAPTDCNGIKLYGADNRISRSIVRNIGADGIWFHGYRTMIHRPKVYNVAESGRVAGDCVQAGNKSDGSIIQGFDLDHRSHDGKQCIFFEAEAAGGRTTVGAIVRDGIARGYDGTTGNHTTIYMGGPGAVVQRVFASGGASAVLLRDTGTLSYSVIEATVGVGVQLGINSTVAHSTIRQVGTQTGQTFSCGVRCGTSNAGNPTVGNVVRNTAVMGFANSLYCVTSFVNGQPTIAEDHNALLTTGGTPAHYMVDGVRITPHASDLLGGYASFAAAQATLGIDANYRPIAGSPLYALSTPMVLASPIDKDQRTADAFPVGAFIGAGA